MKSVILWAAVACAATVIPIIAFETQQTQGAETPASDPGQFAPPHLAAAVDADDLVAGYDHAVKGSGCGDGTMLQSDPAPHPLPQLDAIIADVQNALLNGVEVGTAGFHPYSDDMCDLGTASLPLLKSVLSVASGYTLAFRRVFIARDDVVTLGVTSVDVDVSPLDGSRYDVKVNLAPNIWQYAKTRHATRVEAIARGTPRSDGGIAFIYDGFISASYPYHDIFMASRYGTSLVVLEGADLTKANAVKAAILAN